MPRRPGRTSSVVVGGALSGLAVIGAACAEPPLSVDSPSVSGAASRQCGALVEAAPDTVAGAEQREVESSGVALAWGEPPVIVRCGVPVPSALAPGARCDTVDEVDWFTRRRDDGYVFATIGRAVTVEVLVPSSYEPPADALVDLGAAVRSTVPVLERCQ